MLSNWKIASYIVGVAHVDNNYITFICHFFKRGFEFGAIFPAS